MPRPFGHPSLSSPWYVGLLWKKECCVLAGNVGFTSGAVALSNSPNIVSNNAETPSCAHQDLLEYNIENVKHGWTVMAEG
jgi:hypothetical protein